MPSNKNLIKLINYLKQNNIKISIPPPNVKKTKKASK